MVTTPAAAARLILDLLSLEVDRPKLEHMSSSILRVRGLAFGRNPRTTFLYQAKRL
jgi:hypothetical protein